MDVGKRIRDARKKAGLTQDELAKKTNLSRSHIGAIELGRYNPSLSTLASIAEAVDTPVSNLVGNNGFLPVKEGTAWGDAVRAARIIEDEKSSLPHLTSKDEKDIKKKLEEIINDLSSEDGPAYFDGEEPMSPEQKEVIKISIENSLRLGKQMAKQKFTPNKYKK